MTELEILQHAKDYLDKLAKGIDPLTDREVPENDIINNVRISRCLYMATSTCPPTQVYVLRAGCCHIARLSKFCYMLPSLPYIPRIEAVFSEWRFLLFIYDAN